MPYKIHSTNMNFRVLPVLILLFLSIPSFAGQLIEPKSILGKKELCISDGMSLYVFAPDMKFRLEPLGLSGRTIEGTWSFDSDGLHVRGKWMWVNGFSSDDDYREMDIYIGCLQDSTKEHISHRGGKCLIHDCYFLIERLQKTKKGEQDGSGQPATRSESKSEGTDKPQPEPEGRSR
jgi:hypothetical protein